MLEALSTSHVVAGAALGGASYMLYTYMSGDGEDGPTGYQEKDFLTDVTRDELRELAASFGRSEDRDLVRDGVTVGTVKKVFRTGAAVPDDLAKRYTQNEDATGDEGDGDAVNTYIFVTRPQGQVWKLVDKVLGVVPTLRKSYEKVLAVGADNLYPPENTQRFVLKSNTDIVERPGGAYTDASIPANIQIDEVLSRHREEKILNALDNFTKKVVQLDTGVSGEARKEMEKFTRKQDYYNQKGNEAVAGND